MTTANLIIIVNLFILESLLSVDNAAVLAVMVKDLPDRQKNKALRYGLLGAYVFRGACLFAASWLVKILWLKILGGAYLLYLVYGHFKPGVQTLEEETSAKDNKIFKFFQRLGLNRLWATVILVEVMDLAFSIDNIFAAVALSSTFWVIMVGVAFGILAMRFVAGWFVTLITKHPSLETSAFIVIALLGIKLMASGATDYLGGLTFMQHHTFDLIFSGAMMLIFFIPLLFKNKTK